MKFLSLNIRGFGSSSKKLSLKRFIKRTDRDIVFFKETFVDGLKFRDVQNHILKYWAICTIDSKGLTHGMCTS